MSNNPLQRRRGPYDPNLPRLRETARQASLAGPVPVQPSQPDALGSSGQVIRLPGFNFPPAGTIPVDSLGDASIAPGASAVLVRVTIPDTFRLRVTGIGFHTNDDIALGYLTWAIRIGPDPAPAYEQQQSAVGSIRQLSNIVVLGDSSQPLTVVATIDVTAPLTYLYACRLLGYFYSEIDEKGGR